jgi:hypothetical protein
MRTSDAVLDGVQNPWFVSKSFSASAKWLALDDDLRCSAACKLDDGNRLDAHAILA